MQEGRGRPEVSSGIIELGGSGPKHLGQPPMRGLHPGISMVIENVRQHRGQVDTMPGAGRTASTNA